MLRLQVYKKVNNLVLVTRKHLKSLLEIVVGGDLKLLLPDPFMGCGLEGINVGQSHFRTDSRPRAGLLKSAIKYNSALL